MLLDNFYIITEKVEIDDAHGAMDYAASKFTFTIKLNPEHPVYKGHFPGNPIVPGVCQIQMIKELTSLILDKDLFLFKSDNIKFLSMIIPGIVSQLKVNIDIKEKERGCWHITSVIFNEDKIFLKFKGVMRPA